MQEIEDLSLIIQEEAKSVVQSIKKGRVALYPSDTLWGLGCDITNRNAVARIYEIKKRSLDKPFVLLVDSISMLKRYISHIHPRIETLLMHHVQPLTIIYEANDVLPSHIISHAGTVAIRVTQDSFCQRIISQLDQPLISTSANTTGIPSPILFSDIEDRILDMVDTIVDQKFAINLTGKPSVIASVNLKGELKFLRD